MLWETVFFGLSILIYIVFLIEKSFRPARKNVPFLSKWSLEKQSIESNQEEGEALCEHGFLKQIINSWSTVNSAFMFAGSMLETYLFGARIILNTLSVCIGYLLAILLFQPFFYQLEKSVKSPYEYLEERYSSKYSRILRVLAALIGIIFYFTFLTLHLWGSSIILSILLPIPLWLSNFSIGFLSILIGNFGGLKQFLFVNFLQLMFVFIALIIAISYDLLANDHGTAPDLYEIAKEFGRLKFIDTSFDLSTKYTIWNQVFSSPISWCAFHCFLPTNFKKLRSASTNLKSKILVISNAPIVIFANLLLVFAGIMSFVHFYGCDPILIKKFDDKNQIGPFWLMQALGKKIPFLTGIAFSSFILSSVYQHSNGINTLKNTVYDDIIKPVADSFGLNLMSVDKINFVTFMALNVMSMSCSMLFTFARNSLLSLFFLFSNTFNPPIFGLMLLSIYNPLANLFGAITSFMLSILASVWLLFGRIYFLQYHTPEFEPNTFMCENHTLTEINSITQVHPAFSLYSVSSLWYPLFSAVFIFVFGSLLSLIYSIFSKLKLKKKQNLNNLKF